MTPFACRIIVSAFLAPCLLSPTPSVAAWSLETVTAFGNNPDIAVTPDGTPHVVFTDCTEWETCGPDPSQRTIWHGTRIAGSWSFDPIAMGPAGVSTDVVVDAWGVPHVVWVAESDDRVHYSVDTGTGWVSDPLYHEFVSRFRHTPVLTLGPTGEPHVVYNQSETMRHAYRVAGAWSEEHVPGSWQDNWSARGVPRFTSDGRLLVGTWRYYDSAILFSKSGSVWSEDLVGGDVGWNPWMEVDPLDAAHLTYFGHLGLSYATNASGAWEEERIDPNASNDSNCFVLDTRGRPAVVYVRHTVVSVNPILFDVELMFAHRGDSGLWEQQVVDSAVAQTNPSWSPRIAIDGSGTLHVLYRHSDSGELRYATRSIPTAAPPSTPSPSRIVSVAPNPFNPMCRIEVRIERAAHVDLSVYDLAGRRVRQLYAGTPATGTLVHHWDGSSARGVPAASGVYVVRLQVGDVVDTERLVLVK